MGFDAEKIIPPGAKIKVMGIGGGGGNAVNTMIRSNLEGVDFIAANTDVQALRFALPEYKIQVGKELTKGLGAGADPDVGRDAALEDRHEIQEALAGADMVFITAGMGGGTGTGGASVIAQIAREMGALTVAVVTKPFHFEGKRRRKHAELGIERLRECVDTLITIPNQRLLQIATPDLSMVDAFRMADEVLVNAVKGISDIINVPGTVNVDFADVKTVMSSMGLALMGIGSASGESRAVEAARQAIKSPLLEDVDIEGATGILINITAGSNISLMEVNEACSIIQDAAHEDANIIFGAVIDENCGDEIRVTVIATGFPADYEETDDIPNDKLFGGRRDDTYSTKVPPARRPMMRPRLTESRVRFTPPTPAPRQPAPPATPVTDEPEHFAAEDLTKMTFAPAVTTEIQEPTLVQTPQVAAPVTPEAPVAVPEMPQAKSVASELMTETLPADLEPASVAEPVATPTTDEMLATSHLMPDLNDDAELAMPQLPTPEFCAEVSQPVVRAAAFEDFDLDPVTDFHADMDEDDDLLEQVPPPMESFFVESKANFDRKINEALELAERLTGDAGEPSMNTDDDLDIPAFLRDSQKDLSLD